MSWSPSYLFHKWVAMGQLVFGRHQAALETFETMREQAPRDRYVLASIAHVRAQAGDKPGAIAALRMLVAHHPEQEAGWFNLGYLLHEAGDRAEAEPAFRRALELDPKMDRAWYGLALLLIEERRFDEAVSALKENTRLQPMSPYGWYQLARVHIDRHEPQEAEKIIRHLKGFEPKVAAQLERETGLRVAQPS
jgi:Flp pilus assembly protein TadD